MVWNGWTGGIERVRRWDASTPSYNSVRPTETLAEDVRQAFAHVLAEEIIAAAWHVPSGAEPLTVVEELLDPRLLAARLVEVTVQAAAFHVGILPPADQAMGGIAREFFISLSEAGRDARKVQAVRYMDLAFSAEDGSLLNSPALREIAVDETADAIIRMRQPRVDERPSDNDTPGSFGPGV
jgi:hypothetical protein